jgi:hypothetical protein
VATFNLGPHPRMKQILDSNPEVKMAVPLTDFINALNKHEKGYTWKDLAPEGVPMLTWYALYDAYLKDEFNNKMDREQKLVEIENGRTTEESRYVGNRITDIRGHIEF